MVHLGFLSLFIISYLRKVKQKHAVGLTRKTRLYHDTDNTDVTKIQKDTERYWRAMSATMSVTVRTELSDVLGISCKKAACM